MHNPINMMKNKITPLLIILTIALFQFGCSTPKSSPPDVLFIAIDDMNDWTTLFNKNNPIKTPNLERLAARGCFFTRAYCTTAGCNPSRAAILTGFRPTTSGVYENPCGRSSMQDWKVLVPDAVTLPQYFMEHGYTAQGGGKIFHGRGGEDREDNPSRGFQSRGNRESSA